MRRPFAATATEKATGAPGQSRARDSATFAFAGGAAVGVLPFLFILSAGSSSLVQWWPAGNLLDEQARSFLDGRFDVSPSVAGVEAFNVGGRSYLYFGPFPALLRVPVVALTDRYDGRMGQLSLLLAWLVIVVAATVAFRQIRWLLAGDRTCRRGEVGLAALLGFLVAGGSIVTYLANRPVVYSEAIAWGVAGALASAAALLCYLRAPNVARLAAASLFAVVALQSRATVGVGPALALLALALLGCSSRGSRLLNLSKPLPRLAALLLALIPFAAWSGVQLAKFGSLNVHPSQHLGRSSEARFATYLAANGDRFFSPDFVPTNALAMIVWPAAVGTSGEFPWLTANLGRRAPLVGDPVLLGPGWTPSLVVSHTALVALAIPGLIVLFRRGSARSGSDRTTGSLTVLRIQILCGLAAFLLTLAYGVQAQRYLADALPPLFLLAAVGAVALGRWRVALRWKGVVLAGLAVVAAWTAWVNLSMGLIAQTEGSWFGSPAALQRLYTLREATGTTLKATSVGLGQALPANPRAGDLAIIGNCEALYAATSGAGMTWTAVERGPAFERNVIVEGRKLGVGERTILAAGGPNQLPSLGLERTGPNQLEIVYEGPNGVREKHPLELEHRLRITYDPVWQGLTVDDGKVPFLYYVPWFRHLPPAWGERTASDAVVNEPPSEMTLCSSVAANG